MERTIKRTENIELKRACLDSFAILSVTKPHKTFNDLLEEHQRKREKEAINGNKLSC